ncbi:MAG: hypothetical protein E7B53_19600 [Clostridium sp.]|uniref:hypothetical protein n=1 Tax=Clostridium sp. TaxID=1506 RepID=UPI002901521F|nr:hypothetical protein [Clostridium sp.]MDU2896962.1 hypothetical protein [Clostridium sp.]MDU3009136.1 hypothetical protein [Clostridium sp.]MDU3039287.1 hypothetical protein [Clostridium sp.]MDU3053415.1 hypothetical protein [Clostridium sp.]
MNLICDTNIWYNIESGKIDINKLRSEGYRLVANPINVWEITTNEKYNIDIKKKIVNCILENSDDFIVKSPDEYLIELWGSKFEIEPINWKEVLQEYKKYICGEDNKLNISSIKNQKESNYNNFSQDVSSVIERFLPGYVENRKEGKAIHKKKNEIKRIEKKDMSYMICETFSSTFLRANGNVINGKKISDYDCIKVFASIYSRYENFKKNRGGDVCEFLEYLFPGQSDIKKIYNEKLKVYCTAYSYYILETLSNKLNEPNDLGDLELLMYINNDNKLFTKENKWKEIIKNAGLEEYLFSEI